jgi:ABC-type nitrate/sulfonate/bicarbonate transport system permease component
VRKIVLPAALPSILTGMRISVGLALIVVVIAEMVASNTGIGAFILNAQRFFNITDMYAGIFTLALLGYALNALFLRAEAHLLRYRAR